MRGKLRGRLHGKVAVVTGSTIGIGAAVARLFVAEGARVVLNSDREDDAATAILRELGSAHSLYVQADIADPAAMEELVARTVACFGQVDILVNNAGINMFTDPLAMTAGEWQRCFAVDLEGAWNAIRVCLPGMLARGAGSIVNIASVHGHRIIPGCFPYPVAKHALIGLTRAGHRIRGARHPRQFRVPRADPDGIDPLSHRAIRYSYFAVLTIHRITDRH